MAGANDRIFAPAFSQNKNVGEVAGAKSTPGLGHKFAGLAGRAWRSYARKARSFLPSLAKMVTPFAP